jgi:hypothetical protein
LTADASKASWERCNDTITIGNLSSAKLDLIFKFYVTLIVENSFWLNNKELNTPMQPIIMNKPVEKKAIKPK